MFSIRRTRNGIHECAGDDVECRIVRHVSDLSLSLGSGTVRLAGAVE